MILPFLSAARVRASQLGEHHGEPIEQCGSDRIERSRPRVLGADLFEGRAQAISTSNRLQYLVPNLVDAMFTGFPGNSGETERISIAPENQVVQRSSGD